MGNKLQSQKLLALLVGLLCLVAGPPAAMWPIITLVSGFIGFRTVQKKLQGASTETGPTLSTTQAVCPTCGTSLPCGKLDE